MGASAGYPPPPLDPLLPTVSNVASVNRVVSRSLSATLFPQQVLVCLTERRHHVDVLIAQWSTSGGTRLHRRRASGAELAGLSPR